MLALFTPNEKRYHMTDHGIRTSSVGGFAHPYNLNIHSNFGGDSKPVVMRMKSTFEDVSHAAL